MSTDKKRSGYIAFIGRPNVGKSTLMNKILGKKLSITSRKPQTTRQRILGIKTDGDAQMILVDTPGMHLKQARQINRYMNRVASAALSDVDIVVWVVDATRWTDADQHVQELVQVLEKPVILVLNKTDKLSDQSVLLPKIEELTAKRSFNAVLPVSAKQGTQVEQLYGVLQDLLPEEMHLYPPDQFTDRSDRFVASEIVREKLTRFLGQELPYSLAVTFETFEETEKLLRMGAVIWVEKANQKAIVIGKSGAQLKKMATKAREDLEVYFEKKVFLSVWVKVKRGWSDDADALSRFGYL